MKTNNNPYYLHYAPIDLGEKDIARYEFKTIAEIQDFLELMCLSNEKAESPIYKQSKVVYIFTYQNIDENDHDDCEVFITEKIHVITDLFNQAHFWGFDTLNDFFLFEYESYEDAYKNALDMKEDSPLCYNKID